MEAVAAEVNAAAGAAGQPPKSVDEVAMGFIAVANEAMCRPIRALTQMKVGGVAWGGGGGGGGGMGLWAAWGARSWRQPCLALRLDTNPAPPIERAFCLPAHPSPLAQGYDVTQHVLACFGGAGGQHACAIAAALGMRTIFVHRYSGILSAVGIGLAEVVQEAQVSPLARTAAHCSRRVLQKRGNGVAQQQSGVGYLVRLEVAPHAHCAAACPPPLTVAPQEPAAALLSPQELPELNRRLDALQAQALARLYDKVRVWWAASGHRGLRLLWPAAGTAGGCQALDACARCPPPHHARTRRASPRRRPGASGS